MKRKAFIAAAVVALAFAGVGAAAALTRKVTLHPNQCVTVSKTKVCAAPARTVTVSKTQTVTITQTTTSATPAVTPADYSGNGGLNLPPITITKDATITWTCDGGYFGLSDSGGTLFINSQASSGSSFAKAGTYSIEVNAVGNWTIHIA